MEVKVTKLENCHTKVDVTVDEKTWKDAKEKAFNKACDEITVNGFRKGKAPRAMLKNKVDQTKIIDAAINKLIPDVYKEIIEQNKIVAVAQPSVDVTNISESTISFSFVIPTRPEIKLGKYKNLGIKKNVAEVTDKDIEESIQHSMEENVVLSLKNGTSKLGDTVVIDFKGTIDGVPFQGGSSENYELELGSNSFVPGFEEQLVGLKAGEDKDVKVTFPTQYVAELAGKEAVFACHVHEVKEKVFPKLDEQFVKDLNIEGVTTVEQLKEHHKNLLKTRKENEAKGAYLDEAYKKIVANSEIVIPQELLNAQAENQIKNIESKVTERGLDMEKYLQITGQSKESLYAACVEQAKADIKAYLVFVEIAKAEKVTISDKELDAELEKIGAAYKMTVEQIKEALGANIDEFKERILHQKVDEILLGDTSKKEEVKAEEVKADEGKVEEEISTKPAKPKTPKAKTTKKPKEEKEDK